ncbi:MAG: alpha-L-fucosidase [Gemmatimonadaceae bacterium]
MDRRAFLLRGAAAVVAAGAPDGGFWTAVSTAATPRPSAAQLAWQRDELAMFCHFGVNTFTDREWGDGTEDPAIFNPTRFDARQWARAARAAGFRAMILTAKHHDGFCLWPTATTTHSVASSPWRDGRGDVVREFVEACRAEGLRPGLYLSPWDRNNPTYGDSPRYNDLYCSQLTELLTHYGTITEVWFDGANGEGPNGRKQVYDWPRFWALARRLQPGAVMFSDAGPDVRWCGNEQGVAGDPNWSTVDPAVVSYPGESGPRVTPELQHGDPAGSVWRPAEADVSIRPGWFYHAAEDEHVRTVDSLIDLYLSSVGRNSKLLLNVPPTREGLLHPVDVTRLAAFSAQRGTMFAQDLASASRPAWGITGNGSATVDLELDAPTTITIARLEEPIAQGQAVAQYALYGSDGGRWQPLSRGTTIGYAKLDRFDPVRVRQVRLVIERAVAEPSPVVVKLFG